jgi:hypothetical protein
MRLRKSIPMLAAAATLLGTTAPAYASDSQARSTANLERWLLDGAAGTPTAPTAAGHPAGSSDLALELAAGGIVVAGGSLDARQARRRLRPQP